MRSLFLLLTLSACAKPAETLESPWESIPRLPAPRAGAYTRSSESPPDRAIARLLGDKYHWDASLSGAASGLALQLLQPEERAGLTRWRVREALWRAGYPYPLLDAKAWKTAPKEPPPPQLIQWLQGVGDDDIGLIRARGHNDDVWVALRARPLQDIGTIPRQVSTGSSFHLPVISSGTYTAVGANGEMNHGSLESGASIPVTSTGEWLIQVREGTKTIATFPVYGGMVPPEQSLIEETVPIRSAAGAVRRTQSMLATIREAYGTTNPKRDFILDAGARSILRGEASSSSGVIDSLGLDKDRTALWECHGTTIEACLDRMIWSPENRLALLDDASMLGLAAAIDDRGIHVVGILGRTD